MAALIRGFARLNALGALTGSAVLLLICTISTPVFNQFNFSTTTFDNGGLLNIGMWGSCYTSPTGVLTCSKTSVGFVLNATTLPGFASNGPAPSVIEKPLSESLIFFPLAVGSTLLTLLFALLPIRIVTLLAIGLCFITIGATGISFVLALTLFVQANSRLGLLFNPTTFVHPKIGRCVWFALASLVAQVGAFLFLLLALSPKKQKTDKNEFTQSSRYDDPAPPEKQNGVIYGIGNARGSSQRRSNSGAGVGRRSSQRSRRSERGGAGRRTPAEYPYGVDDDDISYDDEEAAAGGRGSRGARRNSSRRRTYDDEEDEDEYY